MAAFNNDVDVANRVLQHLGQQELTGYTDLATAAATGSRGASKIYSIYDKRRIFQLKRNLWTCATRTAVLRAIDTSSLLWTPPAYSASTTYGFGAIVTNGGLWWQSQQSSNVGHTPSINTEFWNQYFGVDYMTPFVSQTLVAPAIPVLSSTVSGALAAQTYYVVVTYLGPTGETVASSEASLAVAANSVLKVTSPVAATGATQWNVYVSNSTKTETLQNASPINLGTDWTEPTTGLILNRAPPDTTPPGFASTAFPATSFYSGEMTSFNGSPYLSIVDQNTDIPPTPNWIALNGTLATLRILYPIGSSPASRPGRNVFRKPVGFLRQAPTDPKAGTNAWLGQPTGNWQEDWVFQGNYFTSQATLPIVLRFVADLSDIAALDEMFLEMFACDMALMLEETFTQATDKKNELQMFMRTIATEARTVNAIEVGPVTTDMDTWLMARY